MGRLSAVDMLEHSDSLEQALGWHLQSNHFPPIPLTMVQPCLEAIDAYNEQDYDRLISLPDGIGYKGLTVAPASAIVEQHHLDTFIADEDFN